MGRRIENRLLLEAAVQNGERTSNLIESIVNKPHGGGTGLSGAFVTSTPLTFWQTDGLIEASQVREVE